jgi:hypothetical protein
MAPVQETNDEEGNTGDEAEDAARPAVEESRDTRPVVTR